MIGICIYVFRGRRLPKDTMYTAIQNNIVEKKNSEQDTNIMILTEKYEIL
jgi:hypothetical protein